MAESSSGRSWSEHDGDSDESLIRRIREFLRHAGTSSVEVEEWSEFVSQLRSLREELPPEERRALLDRWERVLGRALPDLVLPEDQREAMLLALEAAAAEGAAWAALEHREALDELAALAPVFRPAVISLEWERVRDGDEGGSEEQTLVLSTADALAEGRFTIADRLVLVHLASDLRDLLGGENPLPPVPPPANLQALPALRLDADIGFACTGFNIRGVPAIGLLAARYGSPLAYLVLDAEQLSQLLERIRDVLRP